MPRYRLIVEYAGTGYVGWQRQAEGESIQGTIEAAILRFSGERVSVYGAGRTDAGVHARGQVGHVDLARDWPTRKVMEATNAYLQMARARIAILAVEQVSDSFDARFSAIRRHYLYRIIVRKAPLVIDRDRAWWTPRPLDPMAMQSAAKRLVGRHDFTTFRSANCQAKSPVKTLDRLDVSIDPRDGTVEIRATAQSFLHNQIRSFAGTLKLAGEGRWNADDVSAALSARDRAACGPVAPPEGLYFMAVDYT